VVEHEGLQIEPRIMPQDGRQQGVWPSEAAESPLSERTALAAGAAVD